MEVKSTDARAIFKSEYIRLPTYRLSLKGESSTPSDVMLIILLVWGDGNRVRTNENIHEEARKTFYGCELSAFD